MLAVPNGCCWMEDDQLVHTPLSTFTFNHVLSLKLRTVVMMDGRVRMLCSVVSQTGRHTTNEYTVDATVGRLLGVS